MNRVYSMLLLLVWGVWFGSLFGLLISVWSIARTFPIEVDQGASRNLSQFGIVTTDIFRLYQQIQLLMAGAALILAFCWQLCRGAVRLKITLFVLLVLATGAAVVQTAVITPEINRLRDLGQTRGGEFGKWHGMSGIAYSAIIALLLASGVVLPIALVRESRQRGD